MTTIESDRAFLTGPTDVHTFVEYSMVRLCVSFITMTLNAVQVAISRQHHKHKPNTNFPDERDLNLGDN